MSTDANKLKGFQKRYLKGLAHKLKPIVQVGQKGVTDSVLGAVEAALADHELIKVKMEEPEDKKAMANKLAGDTQSNLVGLIGHVAILYKANLEEPEITLPKRPPK